MPAESFLDTRGRAFFSKDTFLGYKAGFTTKAARPHLKTWEDDACRPLVTEGLVIDALRVQLLERARALGWSQTKDADLQCLAKTGEIAVFRYSDTLFRLNFSGDTGDIKLSSRSFVPRHSDVTTYDERRLGVPICRLELRDVAANTTKAIELNDPGLKSDFHDIQEWQSQRWRWTNGQGVLSSSLWAGAKGLVTFEIELAKGRGDMRAWLEPQEDNPSLIRHIATDAPGPATQCYGQRKPGHTATASSDPSRRVRAQAVASAAAGIAGSTWLPAARPGCMAASRRHRR
jgi:hypothetical protein